MKSNRKGGAMKVMLGPAAHRRNLRSRKMQLDVSTLWEGSAGRAVRATELQELSQDCDHTTVDDGLVADLKRTAMLGHGRIVVCGTKPVADCPDVALGRIGRTPNFMWRSNTQNSVCIIEFNDGKPHVSGIPGWELSEWMSKRVEELLMNI
jgi:hypothetical protein